MKHIIKYFLLIILFVIRVNVDAASYNTPTKSDMTYGECISFQDSVLTSSGNGYFAHCVKATCYGGIWKTEYYISDNMVKCTNGNQNKYNLTINNGCTPYIGSCTPTTKVKYCSTVAYFDCNKTSDGGIYTPPTLAPITTTTTRRTTTRPRTTTTTQTTTPVKQSDNNYLADLNINPGNISFSKLIQKYTIEITEDITSIIVTPTLEDEKAKFVVENNTEINVENPIIITVTAENGETRVYTIELKYKDVEVVLDSNSKISDLKISGYNLNFSPDIISYTIKIDKEENLNLEVKLASETSTYVVSGNNNLKNRSKIKINVTAEDGSETTYLINIKKSNNFGGIIVVILVVGIAGFVGYKLVGKLTSKEEETKYEYE